MKQGQIIIIGIIVIAVGFYFSTFSTLNQGVITSFGVVGTDCPDWKTNAVGGDYSPLNVWIVLDADNDGNYEAYGRYGTGAVTPSETPTGQTPEGIDYYWYSGNRFIHIITGAMSTDGYNYQTWRFWEDYGSASNADTSCEACVENWEYGAWSSCVSGSQDRTAVDLNACGTTTTKLPTTQSCTIVTTTCLILDSDGDSKVGRSELLNALQAYIDGR